MSFSSKALWLAYLTIVEWAKRQATAKADKEIEEVLAIVVNNKTDKKGKQEEKS